MSWSTDDAVRTMIRRFELSQIDDTGEYQTLDGRGFGGDTFSKVQRVQDFGFSSAPAKGSDGLVLALGGRSDRAVIFGINDPKVRQKSLPAGSAVLYDDKGNVIFAKAASGIEVKSRQGKIIVKPAQGENLYIGGNGSDGATYAKVMTVSGPAYNVFAPISAPNPD